MQIGQQKKNQTDHDPMQKCAASWYITNKIQKSPHTTTNTSLLLYLPKKYNLPQPPQKMERERERKRGKRSKKNPLKGDHFFFMKNNLLIEKAKPLYTKDIREANTTSV
jgi:hypothetical protein